MPDKSTTSNATMSQATVRFPAACLMSWLKTRELLKARGVHIAMKIMKTHKPPHTKSATACTVCVLIIRLRHGAARADEREHRLAAIQHVDDARVGASSGVRGRAGGEADGLEHLRLLGGA